MDAGFPPPSRLPPTEFARQVRDLVELGLRTPGQEYHSSGTTRLVPPVDGRFQLDRVVLDADTVPPQIHIIFRWAGEPPLFGVREEVEQADDEEHGETTPGELAFLIRTWLEESLLASDCGIENAIREPQGNVTWLRWNFKPSAQ